MTSPVRISKAGGTWTVRAGGAIIGESNAALELVEYSLDPVIYFPRKDVAMVFLDRSARSSQCKIKGEASYFSIVTKNTTLENAGWSYEAPKPAAAAIAGHLAFYTNDNVTVG